MIYNFIKLILGVWFFTFLIFGFNISFSSAESQSVTSGTVAKINLTCEKYGYPWCGIKDIGGDSGVVNKLYNIGLAAVGAAALGAMIYGGILYTVSAGNTTKQQDAMEWIWGAVLGIVLLLGAYLLFYTINPAILRLEIPDLQELKATSSAAYANPDFASFSAFQSASMAGLPQGAYYAEHYNYLSKATDQSNWTDSEKQLLYSHADALGRLSIADIQATGSGGLCPSQSGIDCTSLNGIPKSTIDTLIQIKQDLQKDPKNKYLAEQIKITGGTEIGYTKNGEIKAHQSQGFAKGSVDLAYSPELAWYLEKNEAKYGINLVSECTVENGYCPKHASGSHMSFYKK